MALIRQSLLLLAFNIESRGLIREELCFILSGTSLSVFLQAASRALLHTHLSITWTVVLGIVGSIIGGAVTHLFYPPSAGGRFHPGGFNCFHTRRNLGPFSLAQVPILASAARLD